MNKPDNPGAAAALADPIGMEVFCNRLLSITEDMNNTLVRASFSTNIKERKDCSVALFDAQGRLVAQGTQIPLHLGSLDGAMGAILRAYPVARIREGDVFICNDPYLADGSHLPDINVVTPARCASSRPISRTIPTWAAQCRVRSPAA
jgi:N-methylhydantoinase B